MRLKSLEIKGFKSFANDTLIHFNERVTGIVGPNGSGKSNIIDAIRWVLGEQKTTELRLDSMSSVIFNGTKKRKPANVARVAITFDNDKGLLPLEFQTLTISRTLYRNGSSEYRINDVVCRLKDISSLLLETGIGSDTYAIIALGMVDDILSDRDQARRRMMEQAAGIVKFKNRKRETLLKLKSTREDLNRIEDLLAEIEDNLKTLEKQAKRTAKYFELKAAYKTISLERAAVKYERLQLDRTALLKKIQAEIDAYAAKEAALRGDEAALEALKTSLLKEEQELSGQQKSLAAFIQQLRSKESDKKMMQQRAEMLERSLQTNQQQAEQAAQQLGHIAQKKQNLAIQSAEQEAKVSVLQTELDAAERTLNEKRNAFAQIKQELAEVVEEQKKLERQIFELEKEIAVKQNLVEKSKSDIEEDERSRKTLDSDLAAMKAAHQKSEQDAAAKRAELEQLEQKEQKRRDQLQETLDWIKEKSAASDKIKRSIAASQHEYDLTKSMVDSLEGFPESIRFLSKQKDWMQHAVLFSDILYCEDDYRVAVENFLEPWLNHFIVPDRRAAIEAVGQLTQAQKGKANFLLLHAFDDHQVAATPTREGLVRALDIVKCDDMYMPLMSHLLQNVYLSADDFTQASDALMGYDADNLVVLHKGGGFLYSRQNISGGSVGLFEGKKIGRKKNLEALEKKIKEYKAQLYEQEKELAKLEDQRTRLQKEDFNQQIQAQRKSLSAAEYEWAQLEARQRALLDKKEQIESRSQSSLEKVAALELQLSQAARDLQDLQAAQKEVQTRADKHSSASQEWTDSLSEASQAFNQLKIQTIQQRNHLENIQREWSYQDEQLQRLEGEKQKAGEQVKVLQDEIARNSAKILETEQEVLSLLDSKKSSEKDLSVKEQAYYQAKMEIQQLEQKIRALNHEMLQQQNLINQMKEKSNDFKFSLSSLEERMQIEFETSLKQYIDARVSDAAAESMSEEEGEVKLEKLKSRLLNFGEINPLAVEAYNEIKIRFDQITEQRDDILTAEQSLLETIREVEHSARERFLEAFEQIRVHFVHVFRSLFTEEDFCDIYLEDPDDPLESPIQIIARPKGKKPQTLQQLSGGEKTLTATALLFSFYLLKPAPFCIFDEVDAPLDDANIEKFNNIIQHFSNNSQFIVVTHNKGTMAAVDVIYGVYMEEQGVSGLSAVDFRKFQHSGMLETVQPEG